MNYIGNILVEHLKEGVYVYDATTDEITVVHEKDYSTIRLQNGTAAYSVRGSSPVSDYGIFVIPKYEYNEYLDRYPEAFV